MTKKKDPAQTIEALAVMIEKHNRNLPDSIDCKAALASLLLIAATRVVSELPTLVGGKIIGNRSERAVLDRAAKDASKAVLEINNLGNGALGWLRAINPGVAAAAATVVQNAVNKAGWNPRITMAREVDIKHIKKEG